MASTVEEGRREAGKVDGRRWEGAAGPPKREGGHVYGEHRDGTTRLDVHTSN